MSDSKLNGNILIERFVNVRSQCKKLLADTTAAIDDVHKNRALEENGDDSASQLSVKEGLLLQAEGFRHRAVRALNAAKPILQQDTLSLAEAQKAEKLIADAKQFVSDANAKLDQAKNVSDPEPAAQPEEQESEAAEVPSDAIPVYGTPPSAPQTQAQPVQEPAPAPEQSPAPTDANTALTPEMKEFIAEFVKEEVRVSHDSLYHHLHDELTKEFQKTGNFPPEWTSVATKYSAEDFERLLKYAQKTGGVAKFFENRKYNFFNKGKHSNNAAPQQETHIPEAAPEQRVSHN
jgi:hypothetical protein